MEILVIAREIRLNALTVQFRVHFKHCTYLVTRVRVEALHVRMCAAYSRYQCAVFSKSFMALRGSAIPPGTEIRQHLDEKGNPIMCVGALY